MSREYSREFKVEAVRLSNEGNQSVASMARRLGISKSTLYHWCAEYGEDLNGAFPGKGNLQDKDAEIAQNENYVKHKWKGKC